MTEATAPPSNQPSRRVPWLLALAAAALGGLACYAWLRPRPTPAPAPGPGETDPRLTFDTPYRNVRPDVAYVGDEVCASCHQEQAQAFHQHPMVRSLRPVGD